MSHSGPWSRFDVYDPTSGHLNSLTPAIRSKAIQLVNAAGGAGVPLIITSSRRGAAEQASYVLAGKSKTFTSRHLTGNAFDVDVYGWDRDDVPKWFWVDLGNYARSLGLKWPLPEWDSAHFEI